MIKCELGKETHISGHPVQIAVELEELMRQVRNSMCELLGEVDGLNMYEEIIVLAQMSEEQRDKYVEDKVERIHADNPKLAKEADDRVDALKEMLFGDTVRPVRVRREE